MKFDAFIRKLLPRDDKFFVMLEESTTTLLMAAELLKQLASSKNQKQQRQLVNEITDLEHRGDTVAHRIFSALNGTFVTPLDREDIHTLTSAIDDVLDHIDGSAQRVVLYNIRKLPPDIVRLCDVLYLSVQELQRGVSLMRDLHQTERLTEVFHKVNQYENEADALFEKAVADLFKKEKNAIQIIKLKEIYVGLERATDKCEDAANVLEGILIKHT